MNKHVSNAPDEVASESPHRGYDFESGMLSRVREWPDLLPWVRLARVLRMAVSPPLILLVAVTYALHAMLAKMEWVFVLPPARLPTEVPSWFSEKLTVGLYPLDGFWESVSGAFATDPWYANLFRLLLMLLLWTTVAMVLIRQGALLTTGRNLAATGATFSIALKRTWQCWLTACVPTLCVLVLAVVAFGPAWLAARGPEWTWLHWCFAVLIGLIALPCGVLGFGQLAAVPLGWAAMVCEPDPDPLDSLSRGYEYLYRRPIHLLFYISVSFALIGLAHFFATWVAAASVLVIEVLVDLATPREEGITVTPEFLTQTKHLLRHFPQVIAITLAWGCTGGIYLLLRRDAGNQEVEDVWIPSSPPSPPLPELPQEYR